MKKLNVAVIFGGSSSEHLVSIGGAKTIISNLNKEKYNVIPIYISKKGVWFLFKEFDENDIQNINVNKLNKVVLSASTGDENLLILNGNTYNTIKIDILFPALLGLYGEDGTVQGLFEMSGIPYVGCGVLSSAICMDKVFSNNIVATMGILQPDYLYYKKGDEINTQYIISKLNLPCYVKPVRGGSSLGIARAKTEEELKSAINLAFEHDNKIILEKEIKGREFKCAVLGNGDENTIASSLGETIFKTSDFYNYDAKYNDPNTKKQIPADISDEITKKVQDLSLKIFKALECSGLARVDFFYEETTGQILYNEINTFPAFTGVSMYPALCKHMGYPLEKLLDTLIQISLNAER